MACGARSVWMIWRLMLWILLSFPTGSGGVAVTLAIGIAVVGIGPLVVARMCGDGVRITRVTSAMRRMTRTRRARWRRSRTRSSKVSTALSLSCSSIETWSRLVSVLAIAAATAASTPVRLTTCTRISAANSRSGAVCQVTGSQFSGCLR